MKYIIDKVSYNVIVERKNNKNTYIRVKDDFNIYVTTNYLTSRHEIKKLMNNNLTSLKKMILVQQKKINKVNNFYYLGKEYDIIIIPTLNDVVINENNIMVKSMDDLNKWYSKQLKIIFTNRLDFNYHQFTEIIPYPNLKIRVMKSRWGVCNRKNNNVTLNANLLKQDITKLDYVIIHELAHFVHFNHSKSFWTVVNKYCPNYKKIRNSMKEW